MYGGGAEVETRIVPRMWTHYPRTSIWWKEIEIIIRKENNSTQRGKVIPERVIQQYNLFCTETSFAPMRRSTLHKILDVCSVSVRNSLQGLDYFIAQGTQAFDDLESVVDKLGEDCGMSSAWVEEKKDQLKEGKRYLKSDYKVPLLSLLSSLLALLLL